VAQRQVDNKQPRQILSEILITMKNDAEKSLASRGKYLNNIKITNLTLKSVFSVCVRKQFAQAKASGTSATF